MGTYIKTLILMLSVLFALSGAIEYDIVYKTKEVPRISQEKIQALVRDVLDLEGSVHPYYKAGVNVYTTQEGIADYFVVYTFRSDVYLASCYKLEIEGSEVVDIVEDYIEPEEESDKCYACPDPDVEALFSTCITEFATAKEAIDAVVPISEAAGFKTVSLIYGEESTENVKNYLMCPKLIIWGRVGHGYSSAIILANNQSLTTSYFSGLGPDGLKGRTMIFNSCDVFSTGFRNAMSTAGTYFYAGGTGTLAVGNSEKVFKAFMRRAITDKMDMNQAFEEAEDEVGYRGYGWEGDDSGPPHYLTGGGEFLDVLFPSGGEQWEQGNSYTIMWSSNVEGNVKIELLKGGSVDKTIVASTQNNGEYTIEITDDFEVGDDYKIRIHSLESDTVINESEENFSIIPEFIIADFPYTQDFNEWEIGKRGFEDKWEQLMDDDLDWTVWKDKTPSKEDDQGAATGASDDHPSGTGNYIYVESSSPNNPDKTADCRTPKFNLNNLNNPELTFWYHMFSDNEGADEMGDLYLDIDVDGTLHQDVVHLNGDHGDEWFEQTLDLSDYQGERVRFLFRAITGSGWASDVCIDAFEIAGDPTGSKAPIKTSLAYRLGYSDSRIMYQVPENMKRNVSIKLYTIQGKLVRTLVNGQKEAGYHSLSLHDEKLPAGLYLCHMKTKEFKKTINIIVQK